MANVATALRWKPSCLWGPSFSRKLCRVGTLCLEGAFDLATCLSPCFDTC